MANTYAPFGFRQLRRLDGGAPTAGFETFQILSSGTSPFFTGDPVTNSQQYLSVPSTIAGTSIILGIFMGCEYYNSAVNRITFSPYFPGSVGTSIPVKAWVCTDPEMLYIAQVSTSAGVIGSSRINENITMTVDLSSLGNTLSGISAVALSSDISTSSSYPFKIYDLYSNYAPPGTNGTDDTSAGQVLVVMPANFQRNNLTGS